MTILNMDFSQFVVSRPLDQVWERSPSDGVSRVHFEREFLESGRTTSIVSFQPGSSFSRHVHTKGEEIWVLEGVFSDEFGDYPAGTYLRSPAGTAHRPFTKKGCKLFVKLDYFADEDVQKVVLRPEDQCFQQGIGGLRVMGLHSFGHESTALVYWPENEKFQLHRHWGGEEIFVIKGRFIDEHGEYPAGTWLRSPHLSEHNPYVEEETLILVKVGHLPE